LDFVLETAFMKRNASAVWIGNLKEGKGLVTTESATLLERQYLAVDGADGTGTNPYELIAAAHAACFSMTLANEIGSAGFAPRRIDTTATITMEKLPIGWTISGIQLSVFAEVPRAKQSDFIKATVRAKTNCTISRLFKTNISMSAKLDNSKNRGTEKIRRPSHRLKLSETKKQSIGRPSPKT
jgi:lipoyl-dependent peroxiredoxin